MLVAGSINKGLRVQRPVFVLKNGAQQETEFDRHKKRCSFLLTSPPVDRLFLVNYVRALDFYCVKFLATSFQQRCWWRAVVRAVSHAHSFQPVFVFAPGSPKPIGLQSATAIDSDTNTSHFAQKYRAVKPETQLL